MAKAKASAAAVPQPIEQVTDLPVDQGAEAPPAAPQPVEQVSALPHDQNAELPPETALPIEQESALPVDQGAEVATPPVAVDALVKVRILSNGPYGRVNDVVALPAALVASLCDQVDANEAAVQYAETLAKE